MAALVTIGDFLAYGGIPTDDQAVAQSVLDGTEDLLLAGLGRSHVPFAPANSARLEYHDGTDTPILVLDYRIDGPTGITTVRVRDLTSAAWVTLDSTTYSYVAGDRRLTRIDGDVWGAWGAPNATEVTYHSLADLPDAPRVAVLRVAAAVYRQRGSEDTTSESQGPYSASYSRAAEEDAVWNMVLNTKRWLLP